jgi:hypothetical protein
LKNVYGFVLSLRELNLRRRRRRRDRLFVIETQDINRRGRLGLRGG